MYVDYPCECVPPVYRYPWSQKRVSEPLALELQVDVSLLNGCRELNSGPLREQEVLSHAKPTPLFLFTTKQILLHVIHLLMDLKVDIISLLL